MSARTDALMSQQETGKIAAFIVLRYGRLSPGVSRCFNAREDVCFLSFPRETTTGTATAPANTTATTTARTTTANDWTPDHAVMSGTKEQLKAMPQFKYSDYN